MRNWAQQTFGGNVVLGKSSNRALTLALVIYLECVCVVHGLKACSLRIIDSKEFDGIVEYVVVHHT